MKENEHLTVVMLIYYREKYRHILKYVHVQIITLLNFDHHL